MQICLKSGGCLGCPGLTIYLRFLQKKSYSHCSFLIEHRCERFETHPVCAEATASVRAGGSRETGRRSSISQKIPKGSSVHSSPWLSAFLATLLPQIVKSLKQAVAREKRFLMPLATFLFSKTNLPSSETGSPLSSQDSFSHENFPHDGGGWADFPRVWPWDRGGKTETIHGLGCPLQLLLVTPPP